MCDSLHFVVVRVSGWLCGWRTHSYPAGHRHHRVSGPTYSGTKVMVAIWTLAGEGEVFGRGVVNDDIVNPTRVTSNFTTEEKDEKINDGSNGFVCF